MWDPLSQHTWWFCVQEDVKLLDKYAPRNGLIGKLDDSNCPRWQTTTTFMHILNISSCQKCRKTKRLNDHCWQGPNWPKTISLMLLANRLRWGKTTIIFALRRKVRNKPGLSTPMPLPERLRWPKSTILCMHARGIEPTRNCRNIRRLAKGQERP